jgi:hypothetical protein
MTAYIPPSRIVPGTVLAGRYRAEKQAGVDFEAKIWRGVDTELDRPIRVRVPRFWAQGGYCAIDSFRAEFEIVSAIDHPGVMRAYAVGTDPHWRPCTMPGSSTEAEWSSGSMTAASSSWTSTGRNPPARRMSGRATDPSPATIRTPR